MTEKEKCRKCGAPCVFYYCGRCSEAHRQDELDMELMAELYGDDEE